jgi:xylulokinase
LLAGVGTGVWASVDAACESAVQVAKRVEPIAANVELMNRRYEEYRKIYPALRQINPE